MNKLKDISQLEDGDVLAEPLISSYGTFLMPAGTPLNGKQIKMLKMWNIKKVMVRMDLDNFDSWLSDDLLSYAYKLFSERCSWKPTNEYEADLFRMGVIFEARKYLNEVERGQR